MEENVQRYPIEQGECVSETGYLKGKIIREVKKLDNLWILRQIYLTIENIKNKMKRTGS